MRCAYYLIAQVSAPTSAGHALACVAQRGVCSVPVPPWSMLAHPTHKKHNHIRSHLFCGVSFRKRTNIPGTLTINQHTSRNPRADTWPARAKLLLESQLLLQFNPFSSTVHTQHRPHLLLFYCVFGAAWPPLLGPTARERSKHMNAETIAIAAFTPPRVHLVIIIIIIIFSLSISRLVHICLMKRPRVYCSGFDVCMRDVYVCCALTR